MHLGMAAMKDPVFASIVRLPQITLPVFRQSSSPSMPETMPPASRTMICPAAMSHGCKLRSQ